MRKLASLAAAAIAALTATSASATVTPTSNPCHDMYVQGAIACQGYYGGNLFQGTAGTATPTDIQNIIYSLLNGTATIGDGLPTDNSAAYTPPYTLDYSHVLGSIASQANGDNTYDFGSLSLSGLTIFGAHFGNNTDGGNASNISAFWLLDLGSTPTNIVTLANGQGVSDAQIFATNSTPAVPEPATWAMMLVGFGATGFAMRRTRAKAALAQLA